MRLIIDISEYNAEYIKNAYGIPQDINMIIAEAIISGKQIPTPHGRLIDADAVNRAMDERIEKLNDDRSMYEASCVSTALDMFAPTVIEAEE